jgi:hypothetical protein
MQIKIFSRLIVLLTFTIFSHNSYAEENDGVMFDEAGLTIKTSGVEVDTNRWNLDHDIYTYKNINPPVNVKLIKTPSGKILAIKKTFGPNLELKANNLFSSNVLTITTQFCEKLNAKEVAAKASNCRDFLTDFLSYYQNQGTDEIVTLLNEVAHQDGVPAPERKAVKASLEFQAAMMSNALYASIANINQKCMELKRYSKPEEPSVPPATELQTINNSK